MGSNPIKTRVEGGILEVVIDRPKANAIDLLTSRQMGEIFSGFRDTTLPWKCCSPGDGWMQ